MKRERIFLTVGTHPQSFERLLKKMDELIEKKKVKSVVFAQTGYAGYEPKNFKFKKFLGLKEFDEEVKKADVVITHGGEGNVGLALKHNKKMIIVPRMKKFNEHTNDHQLEITEAIEKEKKGLAVYDINDLEKKLKEIKKFGMPGKRKKNIIPGLIEGYLRKQEIL
jgi:UDP-N-acetylglucosamine transferase subunit ALG13